MVKRGAIQVPAAAAKATQQFKQAVAFESRADKAQAERELIQKCEKQLQSVGTEPYAYPQHKYLVVAAAKELGISSPRLSAHRDALNEFLYTNAYSNHASVKSAMETFFSQLPGGTK
jgi:H2-forming N5,N10-methylenetetrahydromethanopterin dehydrogenase-like enzyme